MTDQDQTEIVYYFDEYLVENHYPCNEQLQPGDSFNVHILSKLYGLESASNLTTDEAKRYGMISFTGYSSASDKLNLIYGFVFDMGELQGDEQHYGTKNHSSENYYVPETMYLVLMAKSNIKEQCHLYKITTGDLSNAIIGFQMNTNSTPATIKKIGLFDSRNKIILGYDSTNNGKVYIPEKSFFLEGRHEDVCSKMSSPIDGGNLAEGYSINKSSIKLTIPSAL